MTEQELYSRICNYLDIMFPDGGGGPFWGQEPYRSDLFQVFAASYDDCPLHGDQIWHHLQDQWSPRKKLSEKDSQAAFDICRTWSEWQYAWDKHS